MLASMVNQVRDSFANDQGGSDKSDPYKASMARLKEITAQKQQQSVEKELEWATAFRSVQTVESQKKKYQQEKLRKENMLKKFKELEMNGNMPDK